MTPASPHLTGMTAEAFLARARAEIDRVDAYRARELQWEGALLVDIRPYHNRLAEGEIEGALPVERIAVEWRLDPASPRCVPQVWADRVVILFCDEGHASSLAARDLRRIGLPFATDLIGGFRAWDQFGLPVMAGGSLAIS